MHSTPSCLTASRWRPLFGGDEDRNLAPADPYRKVSEWRPLFGGDEDRNSWAAV